MKKILKVVSLILSISLFILIIFKSNRSNDLLILVNNDNPIADNYSPNLGNYDGLYMAKELIEPLKEMIKDMKSEKLSLKITKAYVSVKYQKKLFNSKVDSYLEQGFELNEAKIKTAEEILLPRYSEHHTSLALDFEGNENIYPWLENNSYKYGFVLRYPKDKENITKYNYDKNHYRYVGREVAKKMYQENLCLEEYLDIYKEE